MNEKPIGQAIVICEKVITEESTQNKTLVSTFNSLWAHRFPFKRSLCVYATLTNGRGKIPISMQCIMNGKDEPVLRISGQIEFINQNQVVEMIFNLSEIIFESPGLYSFEIYADEGIVLEARFNVIQVNTE